MRPFVRDVLVLLQPILRSDTAVIRLLHASLADYLSVTRCPERYRVDITVHQTHVAIGCLRTLAQLPHFNVFEIDNPSEPIRDRLDLDDLRDKKLSEVTQYSSLNWASHFDVRVFGHDERNSLVPELLQRVQHFLEENFLSWLEVCSVMGAVHGGITSLETLTRWLKVRNLTLPCAWKPSLMVCEGG